jgi:selenium-binding protein 1
MAQWRPDPTFYPSPKLAMQAPAEKLAFIAVLNPRHEGRPDALAVVDVDPTSASYGTIVGQVEMPNAGDELHHFGWNACSSCLCPYAPHPHMERRYLIVPGIRSSRIHIIDTKPDPRTPQIVKVIEPETVMERAGYIVPHTVHCGPDAVYVSALGAPNGEGPGGIFMMDPESFDILGRWELDRGDQYLAYDFCMNAVVSLKDLSSSIWLWYHDSMQGTAGRNGRWQVQKVIEIPAEPANPDQLPPILKDFKAVPPLVTDIVLSLDDRFLYVSCWGTGEMRQYDVSDPFAPKLTGSVHIGGIARRAAHPAKPDTPLDGGPQMVELSRDGRRLYFTNSLYAPWDAQFYPEGIRSWMVKLNADPAGGISADPQFFLGFNELRGHQIRLEGGDASSDSFCYP